MPFFKTDDIRAWTGGKWFNLSDKKPDIRGFGADSRTIERDFAFVALKGERDGCDFAANAVENGASAVIADREMEVGVPVLVVADPLKALQRIAKMHRLRFENPVVAITGSCGKTTTKEMLAKLLAWKNPLFTEKNFNNEIGVPLTLTRIDMRQNQLAIIEAGVGAPNQMRELADMIEPDIAIVTNVGLTHLERFKEVSAVAKEKAVLPARVSENGWCVVHQNLLSWKAFDELPCKKAVLASADAPECKADLVFRYSLDNSAPEIVAIDMCIEGGDEFYFEAPKMSAGMIEDLLLAIAASLMLGAKEEQLATKIETLKPLPMRGGIIATDAAKFYVDCYNASPTSMRDALNNFMSVAAGSKKLFVLGTMAELGLATLRHHKEVGANLPKEESNRAILVGANSDIYKAAMIENGWTEDDIEVFETAAQAKASVEKFEGGFVFVKGSRICALENALPDAVLAQVKGCDDEIETEDENCDPAVEEDEHPTETPEKNAAKKTESDDDYDDVDDGEFDEFEDVDDGADEDTQDDEEDERDL